jgi:[ribosomal protein S5]-alanine N-acetyltransferase
MNIIFETIRLYVRQYTEKDIDDFYRLNSDPEVMRYIQHPKNFEETKEFLRLNIDYYRQQPNLGRWAMLLKETHEFVGSFALIPLQHADGMQIGYALLTPFWGQGYATEALYGGVDYAFNKVGIDVLVGVTEIPNIVSQRVLMKRGFRHEKNFFENGKELMLFSLRKEK